MTREQIGDWFAILVARFVLDDFPLHELVGDDGNGRPAPEALAELQHMLRNVGLVACDAAANKIGVTRLMDAVRKD